MPHRRIARCLALAAPIALGACSLAPEPETPLTVDAISAASAYAYLADGMASEPAVQDSWWREIGGESLDSSIERLLTHNLELLEARERVVQAELRARQARGGRLPAAGADVSAATSRGPAAPGEFDWSENVSAGLSASFNTDVFGELRARDRAARLAAEAARLNHLATEQRVVAGLARSWVAAAFLERQLALAIDIADSFQTTYALTDERYRAGSRNTSASDVEIARQNLEAALADIPDLETQLAVQLIQIDLQLGRNPGATQRAFDAELRQDRRLRSPVGLPASLLSARPDVAAAELSYRAALEDVGAARADLLPGVSLTAAMTFQGEAFDHLFDINEVVASLAASLTQPVFQGGRLRAEVQVQQSEAEALASAYARAALTAISEVEIALAQQAGLIRELEQLDAALRSAEISNQIAQDRYRQGLVSLLSVLETQRSLNAARRNLLVAEQSLLFARIDLHQSLGGRWFDAAE